MFADTGIGVSVGLKDNQQSVLLSKSSNYQMNSNYNYNLCLSATNWRKLNTGVFIGGDINIGFANKTLNYKDDEIDCKITNNNINFEVFAKLGFGSSKFKVYFAPGFCVTKFIPTISYKTTNNNVSEMKTIKFEQKNLLIPFAAFKSGISFAIHPKLSLDLGYTIAITNKQKLESSAFGNPLSNFDKQFFKFKPAVSHISIGCHYRIQ